MADRRIEVVNRRAVVTVSGAALIAPLVQRKVEEVTGPDAAAVAADREAVENALQQIQDLASGAPDAPSILNKVDTADLASGTGAQMVGASLPSFPSIVTTLGDALPYLNHGEFFGIKSDGSTDDTLKLAAAIEAVSNNSTFQGGILRLKPGATTTTEDETAVRPFVDLDLAGGVLQPNLAGGRVAGIRPMSHCTVRGGKIDVRSSGTPGSSASAHACVLIGVDYGNESTVGAPDEFDDVVGVVLRDLALISDKDLGPISAGGAAAIQLGGNISGCSIGRIRVLASDKLTMGIGSDWSVRGRKPDGSQAFFSDPAQMASNRINFLAGYAFTTHPHDNHFFDILVEELSRPIQPGVTDSGSFGVRLSGCHGMRVERVMVHGTTESGFVHHAGDLGYEFARQEDFVRALRGNKFSECHVLNAGTGEGIRADSKADNVQAAIDNYAYDSLRGTALYPTDVTFEHCTGRTDAEGGAAFGINTTNLDGGSFVKCEMAGFLVARRSSASRNTKFIGGRYTHSWRQNTLQEDGCVGVQYIDTEADEYGSQGPDDAGTGLPFPDVQVGDSEGAVFDGGHFGALLGDETCGHCIRLIQDTEETAGATGVIFRNRPTIHAHGAGRFALVAGTDTPDGPIGLIDGKILFGAGVTNKIFGQRAVPVGHDMNGSGELITTYRATSAATLTGLTVAKGDRIVFSDPSAGASPGKICTTAGVVGSTAVLKDEANLSA
jgi:hypothetical protein